MRPPPPAGALVPLVQIAFVLGLALGFVLGVAFIGWGLIEALRRSERSRDHMRRILRKLGPGDFENDFDDETEP